MEADNRTNDMVVADERNPLQQDVVLGLLFELCELSDLYRFRLVSKQWYSLSLARFRNKMTVVIGHSTVPRAYEGIQKKLSWSSVSSDLRVGGEMPFKNFRILEIEFGLLSRSEEKDVCDERKIVQRNMRQFWGKHGRWIRTLELIHPQIHRRRGPKAFQRAIFEQTPNLEELRLILSSKNGNGSQEDQGGRWEWKVQTNLKRLVVSGSGRNLPILPWTFLLNHFPNVQSLEIPSFSCSSSPAIIHVAEMQQSLMEILQQLTSRNEAQFTIRKLNLELRGIEDARTASRLLQLPLLNLMDLAFHFEYESELHRDEEIELLSTLYRIHGPNLTHLCVAARGESPFDNVPLELGPISCLTKLALCGSCFTNFHFLENFPKLQVLVVINNSDEIVEVIDPGIMENIRLYELRELTLILDDSEVVPGGTMELLAKSIPNVSVCGIQVSNLSLRVICREWKQLKQLSLTNYAGEVDDEGITGIVAGSEDSEVRLPNITDLTELDFFAITGWGGIGESSVWNALLEFPSLKNIDVELSAEISKEAYDALKEKFPEPDGFIVCSRWDRWIV